MIRLYMVHIWEVLLKVLFVTLDKCPNIDAGAVRTHMIAKMSIDNHHDVTVISMGPYNNEKVIAVDGVKYISFRPKTDFFINKVLAYSLFSFKLGRFLINKSYDVCCHTQLDTATLKMLKRYSIKHNASIVYDAVEWFSPEQFKRGASSHTYKLNNNYNTCYITNEHKVISISSYLDVNFRKRGVSSLLMPVVLDMKNIPYKKNCQGKKRNIIYAGMPGKKDYLDVIIKGMRLLTSEERSRIHFTIIGCTKEQFLASTELNSEEFVQVEDCMDFLGRIPRESVMYNYANTDFSILVRPKKARYAQAGFPTKLVESLATATPVICNYTSDISQYIKHLKNGVIVQGEDEYACAEALRCIIKLKRETVVEMQKNARNTAEKYFDYRLFSDKVVEFVKG